MDEAVERAAGYIRERFSDPLTVTEIAGSAPLSRFRFSRIFKEETGISPGRFLAAVRIHEAKRLIENTSMSIADVSVAVGYTSLGSFTRSFTACVGVCPSRFRRLSRDAGECLPGPEPDPASGRGALAGTVRLPEGHGNARVFLGAFGTAVVQHPSVASAVVDVPGGRPCCYSLENVPEGNWYLLAVAVAAGPGPDPRAGRTALVGGHGPTPVTVAADTVTSAAVRLRPARPADPPVLLALPGLEPPATAVARPGCAAATPASAIAGRRAAGHLRLVPPAPVPSRP
ncbi:AraC family transcriptional regulator [Streptomyces sp. GC420]|uniref:helix-turn-helix domain-containing protein n=1 Tax=Streptomyces sp. GC420 TaxID=2697568 RepID=UPI001415298E|nr:AraC family transcriptional regulator [Streptomyces sp. GC420]NBM14378.1 helix-turn-helix domain-containing protein [Streptomyces sp. GC420]